MRTARAGLPLTRLDALEAEATHVIREVAASWSGRAAAGELTLNDLARIRLRLGEPLTVDPYAESRATGAFILIDEATNDTVAAAMVEA